MTGSLRIGAALVFFVCWLSLPGCGYIFGLGYAFGCVAEGTSIATPAGPCPIEEVRPGDLVLSRAPSGLIEPCPVARAIGTTAPETLLITLADGRSLRVTAAHPISTPIGWRTAGVLCAGETVQTDAGNASVASIEVLHSRIHVYDLTIAGNQNFFANGVLVHNKSVAARPTLQSLSGPWEGVSDGYLASVIRLELDDSGHGRAVVSGRWNSDSERVVPDETLYYQVGAVSIHDYDVRIALSPLDLKQPELVITGKSPRDYRGSGSSRWLSDVEVHVCGGRESRRPVILRRPGDIAGMLLWADKAMAQFPAESADIQSAPPSK